MTYAPAVRKTTGPRWTSPGPRVLIVEDHELLAQSLAYALRSEGFRVETTCGPTPDDVLAAADAFQPTVVLLDLNLGDGLGKGSAFIEPLRATGPSVVMLTGVEDRIRLAECIEAGAVGLVSKAAPFEALVGAIREVAEGDSLLSPTQRHEWLTELRRYRADEWERQRRFEYLTPREREVLAGLCDGLSAAEIADRDYVALSTVRSHIRSILMKLGVGSQLEAVALANRAGWNTG